MVVVFDVGDYVVELGGGERKEAAFEMMARVLRSTAGGGVFVGGFGVGGVGGL